MPTRAKKPGAKWGQRIEAAMRSRKVQEAEWSQNRMQLLGRNYRLSGVRRGDAVALAWGAFQQMVGQVYSRNPDPIIRETSEDQIDRAKRLVATVVEDFEAMDVRHATRLAICDVFWAGFGFVLERLQNDIATASFRYTVEGQREDKKTGETDEDGIAVPERQRYSAIRIHPEAILFDPNGTSPRLKDHKWIAIECYPTVAELKDSDLFEISAKTLKGLPRLSGSPVASNRNKYFDPTQDSSEKDDEFSQVAIYEIYDRVNRKIVYLPKGVDEQIGERDWPMELRENGELLFPGSLLYFNENPDVFWPIPEIAVAGPQFEQFNIVFRQILHDAVNKQRRTAFRSDLIDKAGQERLRSGGPQANIPIDGNKWGAGAQNRPLSDVVYPLPEPEVKGDQMAVLQMIKQTVYELIGSGDLASGGMRNTRSATEAAALADFLKLRLGNRTENLDSFFRHMVMVHVLCLQQTLVTPRRVELNDGDGRRWEEFDKEGIQGEFKFKIRAGSSMPQNTETARQEAMAFGQQAIPAIQQSGGDLRPLIEWLAPMYGMPQHMVDMLYRNHKKALMDLAAMLRTTILTKQAAPPEVMTEAISAVIQSGLNASELQMVEQGAQAQAAQAARAQPVGLPGTNESQQTIT